MAKRKEDGNWRSVSTSGDGIKAASGEAAELQFPRMTGVKGTAAYARRAASYHKPRCTG